MVPVYETERLVMREWTDNAADLERVYDMYSRMEVVRWLGSAPSPMTAPEQALAAVERWRGFLAESGGRYGCWAVQVRDTGVVAGTVLLRELPNGEGEVEVGWHFHPDSWGKGLARESAAALLDKGFEDGIPQLWALTHLTNERSQKVCLALGMLDQGVFHDR